MRMQRSGRIRNLAMWAALAGVALATTGCGRLTIRTWVTVVEEDSEGSFRFNPPFGQPSPIGRLQGGFLTRIQVHTNDLDGIVNGTIELEDVRLAGEMTGIGPLCTWGDSEGASTGNLAIDLFGDQTGSDLFLDAKVTTPLNAAIGPLDFEQAVDFDLAGALDLDAALAGFESGSMDGLFESTFGIVSTTQIGFFPVEFALDIAITSGALPPLFDADLIDFCGEYFDEQGIDTFYGINAKSSYLRHFGNDVPAEPLVISLAELGAAPGDTLRLTQRGTYSALFTLMDGPATLLGAVFSETDEVLAGPNIGRIPGAIDGIGPELNTWPHQICFLIWCAPIHDGNNIPEDFHLVPGREVVIPEGAEFLIVSPIDWLRIWGDNVGLGFGLDVEVIPAI